VRDDALTSLTWASTIMNAINGAAFTVHIDGLSPCGTLSSTGGNGNQSCLVA
jgi:hypothetical protein